MNNKKTENNKSLESENSAKKLHQINTDNGDLDNS
jgi:hypothetical protein